MIYTQTLNPPAILVKPCCGLIQDTLEWLSTRMETN